MAYRISKVDPIDLQQRKAVGIDIPFSANGVFNLNYQTKDAIKNNVMNYLLTARGERYMNPTFGGTLRNYLFNQISDSFQPVADVLKQDLTLYFPKIDIKELSIVPVADRNTINLTLHYSIKHTNIADSVSINFI